MKYAVEIKIPNSSNILLELDDHNSPKTVNDFIKNLPFTVDLNVWGDEIYTSKSPISQPEENSKSPVELNDVAYWPTGKAICLFYGPTPIGKPGEITPASPVNVIGKIISPDKSILNAVDTERATFVLKSD
ncbi:cyclophilin-like fold protein [Nitrosopumilus adriaticus]|uniref:cyclophilin-like fold protein n=1 Tax=Nitrosopumilus adriaticus TaxID=1580092 RepID=UPI00352E8364